MATLSAHLRHVEAHAGLPFHAQCPICREQRLVGTLVVGGVIPPRAQAALAAGVLAFTTMAPPALAAQGDSDQNGTTDVTQTNSADSAESPDFDPGGSSDDLPAQAPALPAASAPAAEGDDDTGAIDQQPATDPGDPVVDQGDGSDSPTTQAVPTPPPITADQAPPPAAADPAPTQTPAPQPTATAPAQPTTPSTAAAAPKLPRQRHARPAATRARHPHRLHPARRTLAPRPKTVTPTPVPTPARAAAAAPPTAAASAPAVGVPAGSVRPRTTVRTRFARGSRCGRSPATCSARTHRRHGWLAR